MSTTSVEHIFQILACIFYYFSILIYCHISFFSINIFFSAGAYCNSSWSLKQSIVIVLIKGKVNHCRARQKPFYLQNLWFFYFGLEISRFSKYWKICRTICTQWETPLFPTIHHHLCLLPSTKFWFTNNQTSTQKLLYC